MSHVLDNYCPRSRAVSLMVCNGKTNVFSLKAFPRWTARWIAQPEELSYWPEGEGTKNDLWLSREMLGFLMEQPQGVEAGALVLRHEDGRELVSSVQCLRFSAGEQIRQEPSTSTTFGFRRWLSNLLSFKVLTLGQFMVSGSHGWAVDADFSSQEFADLLHTTGLELANHLGGFAAVLLKDPVVLQDPAVEHWNELGYYQLPVDPSMKFKIRPTWSSFDDYLLDISSKYRVRYRRARKHLGRITHHELNASEVSQYANELHTLYSNIKAEAAFDAINLQPDYFLTMHRQYPGRFRIHGYFLDEELIGFRTTLANGAVLHAHYLGFDPQLNRAHHLYHNILFDLVDEGISSGCVTLDLGRTALEIKSSVGAEPIDYYCALRARNPILNWLIPRFTPALFRPAKWTQRRPFK